jgi:hypothetical protein
MRILFLSVIFATLHVVMVLPTIEQAPCHGTTPAFFSLFTKVYGGDEACDRSDEVHFFYTVFDGSSEKASLFQVNLRWGHRIAFLSDCTTRDIAAPAISVSTHDSALHSVHARTDAAQKDECPTRLRHARNFVGDKGKSSNGGSACSPRVYHRGHTSEFLQHAWHAQELCAAGRSLLGSFAVCYCSKRTFWSGMSGESRFNEEVGDANVACNFGEGRCDGDSAIDRECDNRARVGADTGEPGHREKDGQSVRNVSHGTAGAQRLRKEI